MKVDSRNLAVRAMVLFIIVRNWIGVKLLGQFPILWKC